MRMPPNGSEVEKANVRLPKSLVERVSRRLSVSNFKSTDEYIAYVVDQVLNELEEKERNENKAPVFSKKDQEDIEQRLKDLGYM